MMGKVMVYVEAFISIFLVTGFVGFLGYFLFSFLPEFRCRKASAVALATGFLLGGFSYVGPPELAAMSVPISRLLGGVTAVGLLWWILPSADRST